MKVTYDKAYGTLPTVTKTGYTFEGWYTSLTGGTKVISTTILKTASDHTLYAHWTPRVYTVTLNNQSATSAGTTTAYMKYATGWYSNAGATTSISKITVPTKNGYTFAGYYTSASGGTQIINASGTILSGKTTIFTSTDNKGTLYAHWTPRTYTVTLNNQSATSAGTTTAYMKYATGWYSNAGATTALSKITVPTKTGHAFLGYYTAASGGTQIINASGTILSGKTTIFTSTNNKGTLYARWKKTGLIVTLHNIHFGTTTEIVVSLGDCFVNRKFIEVQDYRYDVKSPNWGTGEHSGEMGCHAHTFGGYCSDLKHCAVSTPVIDSKGYLLADSPVSNSRKCWTYNGNIDLYSFNRVWPGC